MTGADDKQNAMPKLKTIVTVVIATVIVVSGIWTFFYLKFVKAGDINPDLTNTSIKPSNMLYS